MGDEGTEINTMYIHSVQYNKLIHFILSLTDQWAGEGIIADNAGFQAT